MGKSKEELAGEDLLTKHRLTRKFMAAVQLYDKAARAEKAAKAEKAEAMGVMAEVLEVAQEDGFIGLAIEYGTLKTRETTSLSTERLVAAMEKAGIATGVIVKVVEGAKSVSQSAGWWPTRS